MENNKDENRGKISEKKTKSTDAKEKRENDKKVVNIWEERQKKR